MIGCDEYEIPGAANQGRFQYTGQVWLPEFGLYHYKARAYSPTLGRFLQPDPIGYDDGMNIYDYVGSDPVNGRDPTGTRDLNPGGRVLPICPPGDICVNALRPLPNDGRPIPSNVGGPAPGAGRGGGAGGGGSGAPPPSSPNHEVKQNDSAIRPEYCGSQLFKAGKFFIELGVFGDNLSTGFVIAGVASGGTGLVPALGFKAASGFAQIGGAGLQAIAGDPTAGQRAIVGAVGTVLPGGLVPPSLRNDIADLIAEGAIDAASKSITPTSACSRFVG